MDFLNDFTYTIYFTNKYKSLNFFFYVLTCYNKESSV